MFLATRVSAHDGEATSASTGHVRPDNTRSDILQVLAVLNCATGRLSGYPAVHCPSAKFPELGVTPHSLSFCEWSSGLGGNLQGRQYCTLRSLFLVKAVEGVSTLKHLKTQ